MRKTGDSHETGSGATQFLFGYLKMEKKLSELGLSKNSKNSQEELTLLTCIETSLTTSSFLLKWVKET